MRSLNAITSRALCIHSVLCRWGIEKSLQTQGPELLKPREQLEEAASKLLVAVSNPSLAETLTKKEKRLLTRKPGRWTEKDLERQDRKWETLGSLLWALKQPRLDIHLFDAHFDRLVVSQTPGSPATYSKFLETATETRDEQEVLKMFETAQLWHWRAHRAALEAAVGLPPPSPTELESIDGQPEQYVPMAVEDLPDIMEALATHGDTAKTIPLLQNDFCARGKPYRDLPPEIHASLSGIAQSRLYSLGWVLGVYDDWQD